MANKTCAVCNVVSADVKTYGMRNYMVIDVCNSCANEMGVESKEDELKRTSAWWKAHWEMRLGITFTNDEWVASKFYNMRD